MSITILLAWTVLPAAPEPDITKVRTPPKVFNIRWILEPAVQGEMKLTREQEHKLNSVLEGVRAKFKADLEKARAAEAMNRFDLSKELSWKVMLAEQEALVKELPTVLTPPQLKRYQQIEWHLIGLHHAFFDPAVQKQFDFNEQQQKQMKAIRAELRAEAVKLLGGPINDQAVMDAMEQKLLPAALPRFLDVLTVQQKATWKDVTGPPFQFPPVVVPGK